MTSQIQITALYGTRPHEPLCYLLEIDECRILLDCGWDYCFNDKDIAPLKKIQDIDAVLVSHASIQHLGALPYAVAKLGLSCPIYATLPTWKMGQMFMYDAFQSVTAHRSDFDQFTIEDVDRTFDLFVKLKYSQDIRLLDRGEGITVAPFAAGNMIGGTIWKITKETEEIVYAVGYNHKRERHLNGAVLETFQRPTVLITDSFNVLTSHPLRRQRDVKLIERVMKCLQGGGNVLIPGDTAGRTLELLLILHAHWTKNKLAAQYSLVFLSHTSKHTVDFANSMIEWMSDNCQKMFDEMRSHPFSFENLRICTSRSDLDALPKPMVVFATNMYMEGDFAQELFIEWSSNPKNLIMFVNRAPKHTVAGKLMNNPDAKSVKFVTYSITDLAGQELRDYLEEKRIKEAENEALENRSDSESDEGEGELIEDDDVIFDARGGRVLRLRPRFPMFPCIEKKRTWTDYGEAIDPSDYVVKDDDEIEDEEMPVKKEDQQVEVEKKEEKPVKTISRTMHLNLRCQIQYIDFEGRSDGRSIKTIISHVMPRRLILVHGSEECSTELRNFCERSVCQSVTIPARGQCVDITSDSSVYKVVLQDSFAQALQFQRVTDDYEVAYMEGVVSSEQEWSGVQSLETAPIDKSHGHSAVFLGDVKLLDVKNELFKQGVPAEFIQGVLVCGKSGIVNIRKASSTEISIAGALCDDYFKIRDILYDKFIIV
eukprot:61559_1